MTKKQKDLIKKILADLPGPWKTSSGTADGGWKYTEITASNNETVYDGETGYLDSTVCELLAELPNIAEVMRIASS